LTLRLENVQGGPALFVRGWLYATSQIACLWGTTAPVRIEAGQPLLVDVLLDESDECAVPLTIAHAAANVEGPIEVASRQEWTVSYSFLP
jgi:hypothetical protein